MDERALLLLGLLRAQSQHGYQINEFIEHNLSRITAMKKTTAYAMLDRLANDGLVATHTEQVGNRPPRRVYSITAEGETQFQVLLRATLVHYDALVLAGDMGLMFIDELPRDEALACLRRRMEVLVGALDENERTPAHGHGIGIDLTVERQRALLRADRDWLIAVLQRLEAKA